jgi:hypothetical protein
MGDRATTNILLAIIAGVLLFGSSAVTGALKWISIIGGVVLFIYAVIALFIYVVRSTLKALSDAKDRGRDALIATCFGITVMAFLPVVGGYGFLLWLDGVPRPFDLVAKSWVGAVWLGILMLGGVSLAISQMYTRRSYIVPTLRYALSLLLRSPIAPVLLPIYGWRKARTSGDSVISSAATAFIGLFFGLVLWLLLAGILLAFFDLAKSVYRGS